MVVVKKKKQNMAQKLYIKRLWACYKGSGKREHIVAHDVS